MISDHISPHVFVARVVHHWPVRHCLYVCAFLTSTGTHCYVMCVCVCVSYRHCDVMCLCVALWCRLPTRISAVRRLVILQPALPAAVWCDRPGLLYNRRPFLAAKPAHIVTDLINWVGFMTPFAGVTQFLIWSQKTVKIDQMWCQCKPKSFGAKTGMFVSSIAGILLIKTLLKWNDYIRLSIAPFYKESIPDETVLFYSREYCSLGPPAHLTEDLHN